MAIDRMDWHYGGDFPDDVPNENGGTHIGIFLAWIILHHFEGEFHQEESEDAITLLFDREITGRTFLIEQCDEKFWEEDLNEEGIAFTQHYYGSDDKDYGYFFDYERVLAKNLPSLYHVEDSWENYDRIEPFITAAYKQWKNQ